MPKFRKKPVVIEAVQWTGDNWTAIGEFTGIKSSLAKEWGVDNILLIETEEGTMKAQPLDWIIKGVQGEFYPCKPNIFEATYEPADDWSETTWKKERQR